MFEGDAWFRWEVSLFSSDSFFISAMRWIIEKKCLMMANLLL